MPNVAIVGLGWWGRTIARLLEGRVVRGVDTNAAAGRDLPFPVGSDYAEVLNDPNVQAVILCTPHSLHAGQIVAAARAGKHVFCEKPLCLTRADAVRAVEACKQHGVVLGVGHERRFEPPIQELMLLAHDGALGTLLQIEANFSQDRFLELPADNWRLSAKEAPAGPMTATGIHLLDLSVALLGPAERAYASVRQLGSQLTNGDTLAALVSFRSGAHALIGAILATPFSGRFAVYGSKGWAEVRDKSHPESPSGWVLYKSLRGQEPVPIDYPASQPVLANLEAFFEAVAGGRPYPIPQDQMIANVAALEAIARSAASGTIEAVQ